ncbi:helix-turn-helix transcriptional regulator [Enterobacter hormaechei]|uniref:helix-turn-helix transcriptional regulator n=1 Tax=Enterobacter hormaechei TaxID=158836 RepID=UPI000BB7468C|nr:response regulator transcription factor [Enterobacter hormaechei]
MKMVVLTDNSYLKISVNYLWSEMHETICSVNEFNFSKKLIVFTDSASLHHVKKLNFNNEFNLSSIILIIFTFSKIGVIEKFLFSRVEPFIHVIESTSSFINIKKSISHFFIGFNSRGNLNIKKRNKAKLSRSEYIVLYYYCLGYSGKETAFILGKCQKTISNQKCSALCKLGVEKKHQLLNIRVNRYKYLRTRG